MTIQLRISRAQNNEPWLGWVLLVEEHHNAQATLQRLVPHNGGIQVQMRLILPGAEVLETAQVLEVHLAVILLPCPAALRVWTGVEKQAVGVAPQLGDGVELKADDCINRFLLRIVAIYTMIGNARWQAMPMLAQLLRVEVHPGFFPLGRRGVLSRRCLRTGERKSAPACDIHHRACGHLQPAFGTTRTAIEEVSKPECLLATLREEGRIMRGDQFRARVERRHQHALMKVGPVKQLPKLPCDGAFRVIAVATQVAEVDATA